MPMGSRVRRMLSGGQAVQMSDKLSPALEQLWGPIFHANCAPAQQTEGGSRECAIIAESFHKIAKNRAQRRRCRDTRSIQLPHPCQLGLDLKAGAMGSVRQPEDATAACARSAISGGMPIGEQPAVPHAKSVERLLDDDRRVERFQFRTH